MPDVDLDLIDSHCHLTLEELAPDVEGVLRRAAQAGVRRCITIGVGMEDSRKAVALASRFDNVWATAGILLEDRNSVEESKWTGLVRLLDAGGAIGVGETGLDYHWESVDRALERETFIRQIALAETHDLPLVIHCRKAVDDTLAILADHGRQPPRGVFHCFTGTRDEAARIIEAGWHMSLSGIATYKNAEQIRQAAEIIPPDRLLLETDAPYNTPAPIRKKRPNEPAYMVHTCLCLAELYAETPADLARRCTQTTERLFGLKQGT